MLSQSGLKRRRENNPIKVQRKTIEEWITEGNRLLSLLKPQQDEDRKVLSSVDTAALLSFLNCSGDIINNEKGVELFSRIVLTSLKAAFDATSETGDTVSLFSGKIARRIVTDGILPLSSSLPFSPKTDQLIYTCVVKYIIPTCVTLERFNNETESSPQNNCAVDSTLGIEILLPSFLARMHAVEKRRNKTTRTWESIENLETVDEILDALCCHNNQLVSFRFHRSSLSALILALRELETILPNRLSECVNAKPRKRIEPFLHAAVQCLKSMSRGKNADWDSIPPLIYQLCLFVAQIEGCTDINRAFCLYNIANLLDTINHFSDEKGNNYIVRNHFSDELMADKMNEAEDMNEHEKDESVNDRVNSYASSWTTSLSLSHLSSILRNHSNLCRVILKMLKGDIDTPNVAWTELPFRYLRVTPFQIAMGLTLAHSVPRMSSKALDAIRMLVLEEELIRLKRKSSTWFNAVASLLLTNSISQTSNNPSTSQPSSEKIKLLEKEVNRYERQEFFSYDANCHHNTKTHSIMFTYIYDLIKLVYGKGSKQQNLASEGLLAAEYTNLLQSIVSLGFCFIESVKKDDHFSSKSILSGEETMKRGSQNMCNILIPSRLTSATIESQNTVASLMKYAKTCVSQVGRSLLCHLFVLAANADYNESHITVSAQGRISSNIGSSKSSPICQSIMLTASEKFCGMAPNAFEYSCLVRELSSFRLEDTSVMLFFSTSFEFTGTEILAESFLPKVNFPLACTSF